MQDEQMDDMIRAAADQHHPTYNNMAWEKMQAKLDTQLPQKERNRKLLWIFLLFIVAGGAFYIGRYYNTKPTSNATLSSTVPAKTSNNLIQDKLQPASQNAQQINNIGNSSTNPTISNTVGVSTMAVSDNEKDDYNKPTSSKLMQGKTRTRIKSAGIAEDKTDQGDNSMVKAEEPTKEEIQVQSPVLIASSGEEKTVPTKNDSVISKDEVKATEKSIVETASFKKIKQNKKSSSNNLLGNLGLSFSVGPERSYVSKETAGATSFIYGVGLAYNFGKRITISSGFYASKKLYSADSAYYKIPSGFFPNNYRVNSIDANCKVYEIPLNLHYRFGNNPKHQWLAGAGIASFLMKKETYDYDYKYGSGTMNYHKSYSIKNENKHWLSVITISGGYQYQLNRQLSFSAMPYLKLPLSGVGFGNVKLNSAGILFTGTVKPFSRKK